MTSRTGELSTANVVRMQEYKSDNPRSRSDSRSDSLSEPVASRTGELPTANPVNKKSENPRSRSDFRSDSRSDPVPPVRASYLLLML